MEETKRSGMSKDQFWNLIEKAKEVCGTDLDASAVWIKQQLFYMTPEDVLQFHNLVYSYRDAAYKYGLFSSLFQSSERPAFTPPYPPDDPHICAAGQNSEKRC